jgi:hypothetical protein
MCRQREMVESDAIHCCVLHHLTSADGIIRANETQKLTYAALSEVMQGAETRRGADYAMISIMSGQ